LPTGPGDVAAGAAWPTSRWRAGCGSISCGRRYGSHLRRVPVERIRHDRDHRPHRALRQPTRRLLGHRLGWTAEIRTGGSTVLTTAVTPHGTAGGRDTTNPDRSDQDLKPVLGSTPRTARCYQVATTRYGPPEPSCHGTTPTYTVAPRGGMPDKLATFSSPYRSAPSSRWWTSNVADGPWSRLSVSTPIPVIPRRSSSQSTAST